MHHWFQLCPPCLTGPYAAQLDVALESAATAAVVALRNAGELAWRRFRLPCRLRGGWVSVVCGCAARCVAGQCVPGCSSVLTYFSGHRGDCGLLAGLCPAFSGECFSVFWSGGRLSAPVRVVPVRGLGSVAVGACARSGGVASTGGGCCWQADWGGLGLPGGEDGPGGI